jgi:glycosyltransferase involved in cell wall biosynthesis
MKLSVIVLCYNFEKYIEQCLISILSQRTTFDFEVLVRDDFSTDKSASIIERIQYFNPNVKFIKGEKNIGFAKSYKQLLDMAKGEYIAYTDGDDYWTDNYKLQRQSDFLDNNQDYSMTCTGYWQKDENENYTPPYPYQWLCPIVHDGNYNMTSEHFLHLNPGHYGRVFRKNPTSFYDYMYDLPMLDWPINFELSLLGKIKYINFPSGVYRRHNGGLMNKVKTKEIGDQIKNTLLERYKKFVLNNDKERL